MPEQPDGAVPDDPADDVSAPDDPADDDPAGEARTKARIEAAKRRYRATLRNEADTGGGGFSKEYYRSQKPPHWG